jgi:hypothetical protein
MSNLLNSLDPSWLFVAGCALLAWVLVRRYFRLTRREKRAQGQPYLEHVHRPTGPWDGAQRDASALIERQKVELYDLSREAAGRIDSKLILLEQLLDQGQRQIDRMEELLARLDAAGHSRP